MSIQAAPVPTPTAVSLEPPPVLRPLAVPAVGAPTDYKPLVDRNDSNGLSHAEAVRDEIYAHFQAAANEKQVDVLLLKSPPFTSPPWVKVECWVRHASDPALTLRSTATLSIHPKEFFRYPVETEMVIHNDKKRRTWRSIIAFDRTNAGLVLDYLLSRRLSRDFGLQRCRTWPFQLWLPRNKPARLKLDIRAMIASGLMVAGVLTLSVGIGLLFLIAGGILIYLNSTRRRHVLSAGKPAQEPRNLIRLDSWQALVNDLGAEEQAVKAAIRQELSQINDPGYSLNDERIWYWGVDGKEEREQLVARFRRGIAFVQVFRYGQDLFVGWDAHVNCGCWEEYVAGGGFDYRTGELCVIHTTAAGWHVPNEYDINDTNCLLERVHAAMTKVVKQKLAELRIDQEIDFKILREDRQNIAGRRGAPAERSGIRNAFAKLKRVS